MNQDTPAATVDAGESRGGRAPNEPVSLRAFLDLVSGRLRQVPQAWVRCEVLKVDVRPRYTGVELIEHDAAGDVVAKTRAVAWAGEWARSRAAFEAAGVPLEAGIRAMVLVSATLSAQHGFSLHVREVDASYTAGDLRLKAEAIRRRLRQEGCWGLNRALPRPRDYRGVAVISPPMAAGQADFRSSAEPLEALGLVRFRFVEVTFQRADAPRQIVEALRSVYRDCRAGGFCAVAIVRGGGAAADLAYLCDHDLVRAVCHMPVPVLVGIGHETDRTLLDEVACVSVSTPSKVVGLIRSAVVDLRTGAGHDVAATRAAARAALSRAGLGLASEAARSRAAARDVVDAATTIVAGAAAPVRAAARRARRDAEAILRADAAAFGAAARRARQGAEDALRVGSSAFRADTRRAVRRAEDAARSAGEAFRGAVRGMVAGARAAAAEETRAIDAATRRLRHAATAGLRDADDAVRDAARAATGRAEALVAEAGRAARPAARLVAQEAEAELRAATRAMEAAARAEVTAAVALLAEARFATVSGARRVVAAADARLRIASAQASARDPARVLAAGYAILRGPSGEILASAASLRRAERVHAEVRDGTVVLRPDEGGRS
jgi:exodeoxyribonuclease VII large subunit